MSQRQPSGGANDWKRSGSTSEAGSLDRRDPTAAVTWGFLDAFEVHERAAVIEEGSQL